MATMEIDFGPRWQGFVSESLKVYTAIVYCGVCVLACLNETLELETLSQGGALEGLLRLHMRGKLYSLAALKLPAESDAFGFFVRNSDQPLPLCGHCINWGTLQYNVASTNSQNLSLSS